MNLTHKPNRNGFGTIEFLVVLALVLILAVLILPAINRAREASSRRNCANNLLQLGLALRMYADESPDNFMPPLRAANCKDEPYPTLNFMFDVEPMFPDYLSNLDQLVCPTTRHGKTAIKQWDQGDTANPNWIKTTGYSNDGKVQPCEIVAQPYTYYGWAFLAGQQWSGPQLVRLAPLWSPKHLRIMRKSIEDLSKTVIDLGDSDALNRDIILPETLDHRDRLPRLSKDVARFFVTDINNLAGLQRVQSEIKLMHDAFVGFPAQLNHKPTGGNILFMDGHVEYRTWWTGNNQDFPYNDAGLALHEVAQPKTN